MNNDVITQQRSQHNKANCCDSQFINLSMDWVSTIISITEHGFSHGLIFNSVPHTPF